MADAPPKPFGKTFAVVVGVVLTLFAVAFYYAPGTVQARNMRRVSEFIPTVQPSIAADARFSRVHLHSFTAQDGCLLVYGYVSSDTDLAALRELIDRHPCPRPVHWGVQVWDEAPDNPEDGPSAPLEEVSPR